MAPDGQGRPYVAVQNGKIVVGQGSGMAQLTIPAELPLRVLVDGVARQGTVDLAGTETIDVYLLPPKEGRWSVTVDPDGMTAWLEVEPGTRYGLPDQEPAQQLTLAVKTYPTLPPGLTDEAVRAALAEAGVVKGIDENAIFKGVTALVPQRLAVASGQPAVDGRDGRLEVLVDTGEERPYVVRPDGSIDYRDRADVPSVSAGTPLALIHPPTPGQGGWDLFGREKPPRPGLPVAVATGRGAVVEEGQGARWVKAVRDGRPVIRSQRQRRWFADVLPVYDVRGDVDMSTGNIRFNGDVVVRGDVTDGFSVQAVGSVTVHGSVFQGEIVAGGGIVVKGAALGSRFTVQGAGAGVEVGRLHHSRVASAGYVKVGSQGAYFSDITAQGDVLVAGGLVGGTIRSHGRVVDLGQAGSRMGAETYIEVPAHAVVTARKAYPGVKVRLGKRLYANQQERGPWIVKEDE
ncbi:MAG TPA: FapA family protein [Sphingobacteriaceae bacterium]|nr:FapA family protein [Sphingobacteriaceae bacterium]